MNTNEIVDVLNALPTSKLISTVSAGIGKLYEPTHIKRIAKAKAEEIKLISVAMEECSVIPTQYNDGSLSLSNTDWDDFVRRAQGRMAFQELQKQNNIECVVAKAYNILENEQTCSEEPVEQGWINRFFDSVADISDDDLQKLWSKVLAGEILQPKSYSLRTLETLKNLSKFEAELFQKILPLVIKSDGEWVVTSKSSIHNKYGISYDDIMMLDECGLIVSNGSVSLTITIPEDSVIAHNTRYALLTDGLSSEKSFSFGIYSLTSAGKELLDILDYNPNDAYFHDVAEFIFNENRHSKLIIQPIESISDNIVRTTGETVREFRFSKKG